ncbi:MAG: asparagine--tRNA ligase [Bacilli bacterium]|nr:asparagine--tRNA ligase [Bacilli bacterium]
MLLDVIKLYQEDYLNKEVILEGWVKNHRKQKEFGFIDFYDGTYFKSVQIVYENDLDNFVEIQKLRVGSAIRVIGKVISSPAPGQEFEIKATNISLEGDAAEDYPIQPKRHTREFLREVAYLRPRTNLFQAVFRIRSITAYAVHCYFQERGYVYLHSPIITGNDAEGAGEMFKVSTIDPNNIPRTDNGEIDYSKDFFGKETSLTVSGQLHGEAFALAFKRIYTFGPTFRAEKSHTKLHASEFWMIEPEMAFTDLNGCMDVEEECLKYIISYVLEHAKAEMAFLNKFVEPGLIQRLKDVVNAKAVRITYKEAIDILLKANKKWEVMPKQGEDITTEHEKYLTEEYFKTPVFVTDWPKEIKAFYMRDNGDGTVAAVDFLVPKAGELMGGSQREERLDVLLKLMKEKNITLNDLEWYLNLRKYGSVKHSGFGLGFERLLIYLTGVENIRDVIPFPRTPNNCEF